MCFGSVSALNCPKLNKTAENRLVHIPESPEQLGCVPGSEYYSKNALISGRPYPAAVEWFVARLKRLQTEYGIDGRGLHSFPFQLNLSSSVHRVTQLKS